jgi:predicted sulfurtransferase
MGRFLATVYLTLSVLIWTGAAAEEAPKSAARAVQTEAERGGYRLMEIDELWKKYQDNQTPPLLIDTRQDWEYSTGSIEGAIHFPMDTTWFSRLIQRGPLAQALGPDKERILVFY